MSWRAARIAIELKLLTEEFLELLGDAPPESTEVGDNTERAGGTAKGKGDGRQAA